MRRAVAATFALALPTLAPQAAASSPAVQAQTTVEPGPHFFGDVVGAELDVFVDPRRVDPKSVHVAMTFDPYSVVGRTTAVRAANGTTELRFRASLSCLVQSCVPEGTEQKIRFPSATITHRNRDGTRAPALAARWPSFRLVARAPKKTFSQESLVFAFGGGSYAPFALFHTPSEPPTPSYRVRPLVLGSALLIVALIALAAAAVVTVPLVRLARGRLAARAARPSLTPLEEALERVATSATDRPGTAEHRESLARLARELPAAGLGDLVRPATRLAWSSADPTRDESLALAQHVRERVNGTCA
jgi:HAMP domain-containing protein